MDSGTGQSEPVCTQMSHFTPNRLHTLASSSPHWAGVGLRRPEMVSGPRSPGDGMVSDQGLSAARPGLGGQLAAYRTFTQHEESCNNTGKAQQTEQHAMLLEACSATTVETLRMVRCTYPRGTKGHRGPRDDEGVAAWRHTAGWLLPRHCGGGWRGAEGVRAGLGLHPASAHGWMVPVSQASNAKAHRPEPQACMPGVGAVLPAGLQIATVGFPTWWQPGPLRDWPSRSLAARWPCFPLAASSRS